MLYYLVDFFSAALVPALAVLIICFFKKTSARETLLMLMFAAYLAVMLDLAGISDISFLRWEPEINFIPFSDLIEKGFSFQIVFQYVANIILFLPFGFLLPAIWPSFRRLRPTVLAGLIASALIELCQLFLFRLTAVDDLIMNTLGTLFGFLLAALISRRKWAKSSASGDRKKDLSELLIIAAAVFASALFVKYNIGKLIYSLPMFG